jgi:hypothetical protein
MKFDYFIFKFKSKFINIYYKFKTKIQKLVKNIITFQLTNELFI